MYLTHVRVNHYLKFKMADNILQFTPFQSFVESSFFSKLSQLKLDKFKLDDRRQKISGFSTKPAKLTKNNKFPTINLDHSSFEVYDSGDDNDDDNDNANEATSHFITGWLINVNTYEDFKKSDKSKLIKSWGDDIYKKICTDDTSSLTSFHIYTFSDLKKYKFYYWVAFPTLNSTWTIIDSKKTNLLHADLNIDDSIVFAQVGDDNILLKKFTTNLEKSGTFVYKDTCLSANPSIFLKNYLYYLAYKGFEQIDLLIYRKTRHGDTSFQLSLKLINFDRETPTFSGWERQYNGKLSPKVADLGSLIDPIQLASQAVDLNLKLMKWRIAPNIDLDIIKNQKVLLLGAGTLGSYVSRSLLGWGVKQITFIDNGRVSYSNPVRQPLYKFQDCFSDERQGELKAECAARALKEIFPGVNSKGINMEVPMIGHAATADTRYNFEQLEELFDEHDVIFLLMDSRESRWLPTVLGTSKGKIVLNAALGFDSFLVMRHGSDVYREDRLGCYFCNDVVAPIDSLSDRTLDQMCTVTRPGGALLASGLAVELMVSVLQHPDKQNAAANDTSKFGEVPHQIRGFLNSYNQSKFKAPSYKNCSACSMPVIKAYKEEGWSFIRKCLDNSKYLEKISGLQKVQQEAELAAEKLALDLEGIEDLDDEWLS